VSAVILIGFAVNNQKNTTAEKSKVAKKKAAPAVAAASSNEIKMTADMKNATTLAIQQAGFNCPQAKIAWAKGNDAYGTVTKVFCGPAGKSGVYQNAVFRMTFTSDDRVLIEPW